MERNVSPANWLYPDRGIVKWLGYFLSDHTQYLEKQKAAAQPVKEEDQQSPAVITATLSASQRRVFEQYGIVTTVGIGENPLLAKLALDNAAKKQAPWQAFWGYATVPETLWKISKLTDFWGIGDRIAAHLDRNGHLHSTSTIRVQNRIVRCAKPLPPPLNVLLT